MIEMTEEQQILLNTLLRQMKFNFFFNQSAINDTM